MVTWKTRISYSKEKRSLIPWELRVPIGHFHYRVILPQLPESFGFLFYHAN